MSARCRKISFHIGWERNRVMKAQELSSLCILGWKLVRFMLGPIDGAEVMSTIRGGGCSTPTDL